MPKATTHTRKRGVKASPYKLTRARKAAGLESQAAVAQKIADIEGLDNPPKDVVNRAFRGVKVSPDTIDRLAVALGVAPHTLLLTSEEDGGQMSAAAESPATSSVASRRGRALARVIGATSALLVFALTWLWRSSPPTAPPTEPSAPPAVTIAAFQPLVNTGASLRVVDPNNAVDPVLLAAFRDALSVDFAMPTTAAAELAPASDATRGITTIATTARLILDVQVAVRWLGISAALEAFGQRHEVWAHALPRARVPARAPQLARQLQTAVRVAIGAMPAPVDFFVPSAEAVYDYVSGMDRLDGTSLELNVHRAQSRFEAALRRDPGYARALAGLCLAQLEKYWMLDEARSIDEARDTCARAQALGAADARVRHAQARLLHIDGQNLESITLLEAMVDDDPGDADAWNLLAWNLWNQYHASGQADLLDRASHAATRAASADADIWKPYHQLALIASLRNDIEAAIAQSERGLARTENSLMLANLGTFQTCAGRFSEAQTTLERAQALSAGAYVGDEMISKLHYFQGQFDASLRLIRRAIDSFEGGQPANHLTWSSLADAHRQLGQSDQALEAYRLAINIAETDLLNPDATASTRAARLYYYARVNELSPGTLSAATLTTLRDALDTVAVLQNEAVGYRFITLALALNGRTSEARHYFAKATERCRGYRQYPDFVQVLPPN